MRVVPRLLIRNPAMPSHRSTVSSVASNASAPKARAPAPSPGPWCVRHARLARWSMGDNASWVAVLRIDAVGLGTVEMPSPNRNSGSAVS